MCDISKDDTLLGVWSGDELSSFSSSSNLVVSGQIGVHYSSCSFCF